MLSKISSCEEAKEPSQISIKDALKRCIDASRCRGADLTDLRCLRFDQPVRAVGIIYKAFPGERHRTFSQDERSIKPISVYSGCIRAGLREGDRKIASLNYRWDQDTLVIEVSFKPGRPLALARL